MGVLRGIAGLLVNLKDISLHIAPDSYSVNLLEFI